MYRSRGPDVVLKGGLAYLVQFSNAVPVILVNLGSNHGKSPELNIVLIHQRIK
jgi:hypothetical protein